MIDVGVEAQDSACGKSVCTMSEHVMSAGDVTGWTASPCRGAHLVRRLDAQDPLVLEPLWAGGGAPKDADGRARVVVGQLSYHVTGDGAVD